MLMRPFSLLLSASLAAQEPPHADELAGIRMLQQLLERAATADIEVHDSVLAGYDTHVFVDDAEGDRRPPRTTRHDRTTAILLSPRNDGDSKRRLLLGIRGGRVLVGAPVASRDFQPTLATIAAQGVRQHVNNMVLGQGAGQDGTEWQKVALASRPLRIRIVDEKGAAITGVQVEIGGSRFAWHPAWLDVASLGLGGCTTVTDDRGEARAEAVPATGLRLRVARNADTGCGQAAVLTRDMVAVEGDLMTVRVPRSAFVDETSLQEQAWAVLALRQLHREEMQCREERRIDQDDDRVGEFGPPRTVLPRDLLRGAISQPDGTERFRRHLFAVFLPTDADGRERHFVAYAWPAVSSVAGAFAIDEQGAVHACEGAGYQGLAKVPGADAGRTAGVGEPWLVPLAHDQPGRDGRRWRRL